MRKNKKSERDDLLKAANAASLATARELLAAAGYIRQLPGQNYVPAKADDEVYYLLNERLAGGPFTLA